MKLFRSIVELQNELFEVRKQGKTVGLVPTMGALHGGHASLVKRSVAENGVTVVSVFLNPTQFNDKNDLDRYPRTLDADCELLESCGADYVFAPSISEMYPQEDRRTFSYPSVMSVMEGAHRPGHFNGVCRLCHVFSTSFAQTMHISAKKIGSRLQSSRPWWLISDLMSTL